MLVRGGDGRLHRERSASFERGASGHLSDQNGGLLMGSRGPLVVDADTVIDGLGVARGAGKIIDRVQLVPGTLLRSGFLEAANVDAVHEMVDVLSAQRAFETAQKTLRAIDDVRGKSASETARVKA
jgi:flagellar basal-body rod protein FlgG